MADQPFNEESQNPDKPDQALSENISPKPAKKSNGDDEAALQKERSEVTKWLNRIKHCELYRKQIQEAFRWRQLTEEYRGHYYALQQSTDIYVPMINLIFAFIKSEIPGLYLRDPKLKVNPKNSTSIQKAKILEMALNYIWRCKKIKRENKKNVFDVMVAGHSWFKTGYTGEFKPIENGDNVWEFIDSEDYFAYHLPYEDVYFNVDSNDPPFDCSWIAHKVWLPVEDVKKDERFQHTDNLSGDDRYKIDYTSYTTTDKLRYDSDTPMACLYEVWDKKTKQVFVISDSVDQYLQAPRQWPYKMEGFPFSYLRFNEDPKSPYGIPDCYMFEPHVIELMKALAQRLDHIKRYNRQLLARKGALSDTAKSQFQQGITGAVIEADISAQENIANVITTIPYPQLQTDIYAVETTLKDYLVLISGKPYSDFGGKQDTTTRTLGELETIQKGAESRRAEKIEAVEEFTTDIADNLVALIKQFADAPWYVRVTGQMPQEIMQALQQRPSINQPGAITSDNGFTITKEDIDGDYDIEIVPGSMVPMDEQQKVQFLIQTLQMLPNLGAMPGGPVMQTIGIELAEELELFELVDAMKKESQMAMQMKQEQQQKQDQQTQLQIGQVTADTQIKAEREATKQTQVLLDAITKLREPNGSGK